MLHWLISSTFSVKLLSGACMSQAEYHRRWAIKVFGNIWCLHVINHRLNQGWPRFMTPYDVTVPNGSQSCGCKCHEKRVEQMISGNSAIHFNTSFFGLWDVWTKCLSIPGPISKVKISEAWIFHRYRAFFKFSWNTGLERDIWEMIIYVVSLLSRRLKMPQFEKHIHSVHTYMTLDTPNCLGGIIFLGLPCTVNIIPDDVLLMAGTGPLWASTYSHMIRIYSGAALRRLMSLELPPISAGCHRPSWRLVNENAFKIFDSQRNIEKYVLLRSQDCAYWRPSNVRYWGICRHGNVQVQITPADGSDC